MKSNKIFFLLLCTVFCVPLYTVDADDDDVDDDDQKLDELYESFYVDPLSGKNEESEDDKNSKNDISKDQNLIGIVIEPKVLQDDPQYFIEQAQLEEQDITDIQEQNLPLFLMVREAIEAAESYEQAGQAFLDKNDTAQALQVYQKALEMYEYACSIAKERHEHRALKHAIRSTKYILNELQNPKNKKVKNKKIKNKKGEK